MKGKKSMKAHTKIKRRYVLRPVVFSIARIPLSYPPIGLAIMRCLGVLSISLTLISEESSTDVFSRSKSRKKSN